MLEICFLSKQKTLQSEVLQRFILGLLSIGIFINDLEDEIEIVLIKFANEVKQKACSCKYVRERLGFKSILSKEVRDKMVSMPTIHGRSHHGFRFHLFKPLGVTSQQEG